MAGESKREWEEIEVVVGEEDLEANKHRNHFRPSLDGGGNSLLTEVIDAYVRRTFTEDLDLMSTFGGMEAIYAIVGHSNDLRGINSAQVEVNAKKFGVNRIPRKSTTPLWQLIWTASSDPMLRILTISSVVSLILALTLGENKKVEWIEGAAILAAVIIVVGVTAINDYVKEQQFAVLFSKEEKYTQVCRNGEKIRIFTDEVVVGDIIQLEAGDEISADAVVLYCTDLRIDESSLTGESHHTRKDVYQKCVEARDAVDLKSDKLADLKGGFHDLVPSPILLSGTTVGTGTCAALVVAVGGKSQFGKLFTKLTVDTEPTPLQNKLNAMARDVGKAGFVIALITLFILLTQYFVQLARHEVDHSPSRVTNTIVSHVATAITIVVVAVPEGLPLAVTISLAFSVGRMLKDQNYVRRLAACETMGGANEICSDKTGTLTKNQMEVQVFWNGSVINDQLSCREDYGLDLPPAYRSILLQNIAINSTGFLQKEEVRTRDNETEMITKQVGSPTDCALLELAERAGLQINIVRAVYTGLCTATSWCFDNNSELPFDKFNLYSNDQSLILLQIPFTSEKKAMTTIVRHLTEANTARVFIKGASEVILRRCSQRIDSEGKLKSITAEKITKIESMVVHCMAGQALRTICLAYKDFDVTEHPNFAAEVDSDNPMFLRIESNLICLGIAGVRDPLREEVPKAVQDCLKAGVRVRMCTGDNIETARQIALKAGIYHPEAGGIAMLGYDFLKLVGPIICAECRLEQCECHKDSDHNSDIGVTGCFGHPHTQAKIAKMTQRNDVLANQAEFAKIVDNLEVMARSQPNDKYALVTGLRNLGRVVAVTGDGTNDALALRKADVGFAMGITGKETAKQAADIVLMDDNFSSIVKAIKWGRNVYDNIQRFLQFQLTVNCVAVITAFVGACALRASPLTAVQLLWVNLIMDTFAALALATGLPTDQLLERKPHARSAYLLTRSMWRNILIQGMYQITVMMLMIFSGDCWLPEFNFKYDAERFPDYSPFSTCGKNHVRSGRLYHPFTNKEDYKESWTLNITPSRHYTYVFNTFVCMQAFNLLNARKIRDDEWNIFEGLNRNPYWSGIMVVIVIGQILMVEFGYQALSVHQNGLTWQQWLICLAFGVGTWIVGALSKCVPTRLTEWLPETHNKEINPLNEPTSLALASRGRISNGRITSRMNIDSAYMRSPNDMFASSTYLMSLDRSHEQFTKHRSTKSPIKT